MLKILNYEGNMDKLLKKLYASILQEIKIIDELMRAKITGQGDEYGRRKYKHSYKSIFLGCSLRNLTGNSWRTYV